MSRSSPCPPGLPDWRISPAVLEDLPQILDLFDAAVAWLTQRGLHDQWGSTPFSDDLRIRERLLSWVQRGDLHIACSGTEMVGTVAVGPHTPDYAVESCRDLPVPAYYLEAFTTERRHAGSGIGTAILDWAGGHARTAGANYLRLDCWSDNQDLVAYYRQAGFQPCGEFLVGEWRGQLMHRDLYGGIPILSKRLRARVVPG